MAVLGSGEPFTTVGITPTFYNDYDITVQYTLEFKCKLRTAYSKEMVDELYTSIGQEIQTVATSIVARLSHGQTSLSYADISVEGKTL